MKKIILLMMMLCLITGCSKRSSSRGEPISTETLFGLRATPNIGPTSNRVQYEVYSTSDTINYYSVNLNGNIHTRRGTVSPARYYYTLTTGDNLRVYSRADSNTDEEVLVRIFTRRGLVAQDSGKDATVSIVIPRYAEDVIPTPDPVITKTVKYEVITESGSIQDITYTTSSNRRALNGAISPFTYTWEAVTGNRYYLFANNGYLRHGAITMNVYIDDVLVGRSNGGSYDARGIVSGTVR